MKYNKKIAAALGVAAIAVAGAGVAVASWTSSATGSGSAKSFNTVTSDITAVAPTADLYPGGTGAASVTIKNNNPYPASVTSISAGTSDASGSCAANSVTSDAVPSPGGVELAAGASGVYAIVTHMSASATNACRNATFTLPLTAVLTTGTGTSSP
jgi:hypothetical protein